MCQLGEAGSGGAANVITVAGQKVIDRDERQPLSDFDSHPQGRLPAKVTPRVSNSLASDSCAEPENTSTSPPRRTSTKPT